MDDAQSFTSQILNTYNPNSVIPFTDTDGFYHFTYLTINTVNNKFYLGKHTTKDLNDGYIGSGTALTNAVWTYGYLNFKQYKLQFFNTSEEAYLAEESLVSEEYLKKYKDELKVCYNLVKGGKRGGLGFQRTKGIYKIQELGMFGGGGVPFGYCADKQAEGGLRIIEDEAKIIRSIFYYKDRKKWGYLRIANRLNERGCTKRDGKLWTAKNIQYIILHKAFYQGKKALHTNQPKTNHKEILK